MRESNAAERTVRFEPSGFQISFIPLIAGKVSLLSYDPWVSLRGRATGIGGIVIVCLLQRSGKAANL